MVEPTLIIIAGMGIAFLIFCIRACYMSKCRKVEITWRGVKIERDVSREENVSKLHLDIPKVSQ